MTDVLIVLAAYVVGPAGFVLVVLVLGALATDIRRDWRAEFPSSSAAALPPRAAEPANARRAVREAVGSASATPRRRSCS